MTTPSSSTPDSAEELLRNSSDEATPWVVQKYGGTSVGKSINGITEIVKSYVPNSRVILVCSARSSHTKALGTTNLLLQASREALLPPLARTSSPNSGRELPLFPKRVGSTFFGGEREPSLGKERDLSASMMSSISSLSQLDIHSISPSPFQPSGVRSRSPTSPSALYPNGGWPSEAAAFHATVDVLLEEHLKAAESAVSEGPLREELRKEIENDCDSIRIMLNAAQILHAVSPRTQDLVVGTGERLACKIVAAALRDRGIDSELVVLDNIIDEDEALSHATGGALVASGDQGVAQLGQEFYNQLAARIGERIRDCGARVPVVTGYFGPVPGSLLTQVGRGYTDLCAALCAVGLSASELQVWKEVDGIFTADPRKVPSARLLPVITPDEAAELTYYGSEVIHPFTMEQVIRARIPIRIKNVENPGGSGTIIHPDEGFPQGLYSRQSNDEERGKEDGKMPTAVTIKDSIIVLNIHSNRKTISHGFLARIFGTLDKAGVVVDLISTSEVHVSMAMQDFLNQNRLDYLVRDLERIGDITVSRDMAILSLVGRNMRNAIGSAGLMFTSLAKAMINIEMISQGASEINISCVIENKDAIKALNVIHESCLMLPRHPLLA